MSLDDIRHQDGAIELIRRALARDRVPHAYIFHGPEGVGKETTALALAAELLDGPSSSGADAGGAGIESHPDLHLVYRQLGRVHPDADVRKRKALGLGVDVVRHFVIDPVRLTPTVAAMKVFVLREADSMNAAAQNALLKTLEEPPEDTVIVLLCASLEQLLPTTLSRCRIVGFDRLPISFVEEKLAELLPESPASQRRWYALASDGSIGLGVCMAEEDLHACSELIGDGLLGLQSATVSEAVSTWMEQSKALGARFRKRDPDITDTEATRRGLKRIFHLASIWYGDVLRVGCDDDPALVNASHGTRISEVCSTIDPELAAAAIERLCLAGRQLDLSVNVQLCIETLLGDLAHIAAGTAIA